jgi:hypothetical protein
MTEDQAAPDVTEPKPQDVPAAEPAAEVEPEEPREPTKDDVLAELKAAGRDHLAASEAENYARAYADAHPIIEPEGE